MIDVTPVCKKHRTPLCVICTAKSVGIPEFLRVAGPADPPHGGVESTLAERASTYGSFTKQAQITQEMKIAMHVSPNYQSGALPYDMREALDMIASKMARILNGDFNYADSWHDIAGYALLIEKRLTKGDLTV